MSTYNVNIDLTEVFEQLETQDRKDFILEAISMFDRYNDNLDVVAEAAANLTETQQEDLIKEVFDYIRYHQVSLVTELIDKLSANERQAIWDYLTTKE